MLDQKPGTLLAESVSIGYKINRLVGHIAERGGKTIEEIRA
ncbi:hypothetical protein [Paenibacillus sp. yr247]|nr:hypothetical protein [Paenibacillus sp. yr247]